MSPLVLVGMLLVAASSAVLGDVSHILGSSGGTPSQAAEINYNLASPQPRDFWWMDPNSPLKAAYDYYKKCAAKGNCLPPTALGGEGQAPQNQAVAHPQPFRPQPNPFAPQQQQQIDINKNPFFNGQFQGITDKIPHQQQQGGQGAGSHQQQQRPLHIDISKNPFFNGVVTTGSGAPIPKGEGFLGVQPAQPFNNNGNKKPFATTHPLESKKPFATTHPLNGPVVECRGSGKICVDKEVCVNGVVNKNGEGLLQVRTDVQYCDSNREVCCKLHAGETPKSPVLSGFNDLTGITAGKSSVPGLIKFQGAAGLSPGSIQVILDDPQLKPSIYSVGESGSQHSSSSTPKTIRDVSPGSNSVFSSTVDYSDTKFDDIVGASAFQGPAYLPPKGTPTPPRYNTPEPDLPSVSTYQPSIPTRAPSSPRPFNTTPRPTPPPYTIPVIVSSPSAGTTFVSRQPSFPSTYLPPASSPRPFPTTQRVSSTYLPPTRPPPTRPPPTRPPPPPTTVREYLPPSSTPYYNNQYVTKPTPRPTYPSTPPRQSFPSTTSREYLPPSSNSNNQYVTKTTQRPTYPSTPRPTYPSTPRPTYPSPTYPSTPRQTYPSPTYPSTPRQTYPSPTYPSTPRQTYPSPTYPSTPRQTYPSTPRQTYPSTPRPTTVREYLPPSSSNNINNQYVTKTTPRPAPRPTTSREYLPPFENPPSSSRPNPFTLPDVTPRLPLGPTPITFQPSPSSQRPQTQPPFRPQPSTPNYQYPSPSSQRPQTQPPFRPQPSTPGYQYPSPSSQRPQTQPPFKPQPSTPGYQYPSPSSQRPQTQPPFRPQPSTPGYQYPSPSSQRPQTQPPFRPQPSTQGYQYPSPTTQRPTQPPYRPQPSTNNGYQYPSPSTPRPTQPPYRPQPSTNNGYQYPSPSTARPQTQPPYKPQPSTNNGYQYPSPSTARPQTQPPYKPQPSTNNGYQYPSPSTPRPYSPQPSTPGYQYPSPSTARPQTRPPYQPQPSTNNGYQYPSPSTARPQTQPPYKPQPSPSTNSGYQYPRPSTQQPSPSPSNTRPSVYLPPATAPTSRPTYTPRVPQPGGQSTVYIPPATQPSRPPTGGYTYPKPTPTFGYPTPSTPPIGGESNNVNNNYLPPPKKPYTEPPYSPSEPPPYSSLPPSRPTQPPYSRPTQPPYSRPTQPPYSRPPTQTYLPPTRPPTDNIPEPDTPTDVRLLPKSCAAALKCVQEIYCTADGLISGVPVVLTKEQEINRVPTTTCLEVQSGTIGKCCRDPNYVDPWPSANLVNGEDDGQYKEDDSFGKYTPDLNRIVRSDTESQRPPQTEQFQNPPPQQPECGARHSGTNPPGVGPLDVNFAEIPWQAMILRDSNRSLLCGGAIIKRNAVLTTAHCVQGLETSDVLVKGGEWKLGIDEEPLPFQIVKVSAIVRHPEYKHGSLVNDLAILFLEEKLRPAKNIGTICLPPPNQIPTQNCIATGWGKRILQLHAKGAIMHAIDINVMETNQCRETLADQFQHALDNYSPNTLCGYSNKDQCRVDHGSALACSPGGNGQYTLSGIFAWDTGCKHKGQIGGYIAPDVEWIENSLSKPFNELKQLERNYVSTQQ